MSANRKPGYDVAIVGAGVIGLSIAWRAARSGMSTCVIDAERPGAGASGVAAGMLAPVTEANFGERELVALNLEGARRYPGFVAELEAETGLTSGYRRCGTLALATDRDELESLEHLHSLQRSLGLQAEWLSGSEARRLEPALSRRVRGGVHAPDDHQISPRALIGALVSALESAEVDVLCPSRVKGIVTEAGEVSGLSLDSGGEIDADQVVIAAGCRSSELEGVGHPPHVRPVKGQILRLRGAPGQPLTDHVIRTPEVYAVPRADGRLVVGATVEERGFDRSVTAGAVLELLRRIYDVLPGVTEFELSEASAGLRPATFDNGPVVGRGEEHGLIWATGHWRNGVLLAPITAEAVVALLTGSSPPHVFDPFSCRRFGVAEAVR